MEALQRTLFRLFAFARKAPASVVVGLLGGLAALLLVITEFSTIVSIDVLTSGTCEEIADPAARDACQTSGFEQHGGALLLLAVAVVLMTLGAARRASRPACLALIALGAIVLLVWLLRDLPRIDETGLVGIEYEQAKASAAFGFYTEIVAGVLCVAAGVVGLVAARRSPESPEREPEPPPEGRSRRSRRTTAG